MCFVSPRELCTAQCLFSKGERFLHLLNRTPAGGAFLPPGVWLPGATLLAGQRAVAAGRSSEEQGREARVLQAEWLLSLAQV